MANAVMTKANVLPPPVATCGCRYKGLGVEYGGVRYCFPCFNSKVIEPRFGGKPAA